MRDVLDELRRRIDALLGPALEADRGTAPRDRDDIRDRQVATGDAEGRQLIRPR